MINKNFKKILTAIMCSTSTGTSAPNSKDFSVTTTDGTVYDYSSSSYGNNVIATTINALNDVASTSSFGKTYFKIGTGTTAATEDDYDLESEGITGVTIDSVYTAPTSNATKIYTVNISNANEESMTVNEIGFFMCGDSTKDFMLDRTVLDTEITIPAGESKAVTYEIGF